jgi:hypothetical protein
MTAMGDDEFSPGTSTATATLPESTEPAPSDRPVPWLDLLKAVALPVVTLILGFVFNASLNSRQARENNIRLYTEMMGRREESDSVLRKDMFGSILSTFLRKDDPKLSSDEQLDQHILSLELLAYNFHEALDLGPLFKYVQRRIPDRQDPPYGDMQRRIAHLTQEVIDRQLTLLADTGMVERGDVTLDNEQNEIVFGARAVSDGDSPAPEGASLICLSMPSSDGGQHFRQFRLQVSKYDPMWREIEVQLDISRVLASEECLRADLSQTLSTREIHTKFWLGAFDFPMIDNVHLTHGERCAVSLAQMTNQGTAVAAKIAVAYFPGSRASLKDKPYYDDLVHDLLKGEQESEHRVR